MWCSSPAKTPRTACTASRRPELNRLGDEQRFPGPANCHGGFHETSDRDPARRRLRCVRRHHRLGAGQISEPHGQDPGALRAGRRHRHHRAHRRRPVAEDHRPALRDHQQAGRLRPAGDRRNGEGCARRLHADDRQRVDQRHHADPLQQENDLRLRQERDGGDRSDRRAGLHAGDDGERFPGQERGRADRLRQEKPRQGALRHRRRRLLPALRHGLFRQARRRPRHGRRCPTRTAPPA